MVICDWKIKGNLVRLYCCEDDKFNDIWGDDWDDVPYEHNAGEVYEEYIDGIIDICYRFDAVIMEARDDWSYQGNSPYSKESFKLGQAPIFVIVWPQENEWWGVDDYHQIIGCRETDRLKKVYLGQDIDELIVAGNWFTWDRIK